MQHTQGLVTLSGTAECHKGAGRLPEKFGLMGLQTKATQKPPDIAETGVAWHVLQLQLEDLRSEQVVPDVVVEPRLRL